MVCIGKSQRLSDFADAVVLVREHCAGRFNQFLVDELLCGDMKFLLHQIPEIVWREIELTGASRHRWLSLLLSHPTGDIIGNELVQTTGDIALLTPLLFKLTLKKSLAV